MQSVPGGMLEGAGGAGIRPKGSPEQGQPHTASLCLKYLATGDDTLKPPWFFLLSFSVSSLSLSLLPAALALSHTSDFPVLKPGHDPI